MNCDTIINIIPVHIYPRTSLSPSVHEQVFIITALMIIMLPGLFNLYSLTGVCNYSHTAESHNTDHAANGFIFVHIYINYCDVIYVHTRACSARSSPPSICSRTSGSAERNSGRPRLLVLKTLLANSYSSSPLSSSKYSCVCMCVFGGGGGTHSLIMCIATLL